MECKRCENPVDSGVVYHRTHPVTGIQEAYHYQCARCDVCDKPRGQYGHGPIYECKGFLVHLSCFQCERCKKPITTDCGNEWELPDAQKRVDWILGKDGKSYHQECHPCDRCGLYEIPGTKEKPRIYWDRHGKTVVRHASCRRCLGCTEPVDAGYLAAQLLTYHQKCSFCVVCDKGFNIDFLGGPQVNRYVDSDGQLFHFQCATCGICGKQGERAQTPDRTLYLYDGKLCHSDCIPCMECHGSASGIHVNIVHTRDTDVRKRNYKYRHPAGKCPRSRSDLGSAGSGSKKRKVGNE
jgi:hypothetical protein